MVKTALLNRGTMLKELVRCVVSRNESVNRNNGIQYNSHTYIKLAYLQKEHNYKQRHKLVLQYKKVASRVGCLRATVGIVEEGTWHSHKDPIQHPPLHRSVVLSDMFTPGWMLGCLSPLCCGIKLACVSHYKHAGQATHNTIDSARRFVIFYTSYNKDTPGGKNDMPQNA